MQFGFLAISCSFMGGFLDGTGLQTSSLGIVTAMSRSICLLRFEGGHGILSYMREAELLGLRIRGLRV